MTALPATLFVPLAAPADGAAAALRHRIAPEVSMVQAVEAHDWSATPLGPTVGWPASLRASLSICLHSHFPMVVLWGPQLLMFYNDAYIPVLGRKHPWALGRPISQVWSELWPTIGPMLEGVIPSGEATWSEDLPLYLMRRGFLEECYFTFSYSPIRAEGGTNGGVFVAVLETTERVVNERRLRALGAFGARLPLARDEVHALQLIGEVLQDNPHAFPWTALYLRRDDGIVPVLCANAHHSPPLPVLAPEADHPVAAATRTGEVLVLPFDSVAPPGTRCGVWPEPPRQALALPLQLRGHEAPSGVLVLAANPRRPFDAEYRAFMENVAREIVTALSNIEAMETERRRVQTLAELDRAKSQLFANVSHELRTPVTLVLGPLEEALAQPQPLPELVRESLEVAMRNARRLKKLVDAVLDIARLESNRLLARPEPTDVLALTEEITSLFRSAAQARGIGLTVRACSPLPPVPLDPRMWEHVVINLVSNALKCTREGRVELELGGTEDSFFLAVRDTGCGIDEAELPLLFQRFYRTRTSTRLAIEGTGLGLAIVQQLVRLHGGRIEVASRLGQGSVFTVTLPSCAPATVDAAAQAEAGAMVVCAPVSREAFVAEIETAPVPRVQPAAAAVQNEGAAPPLRVLVADDNADLTAYLSRLLAPHAKVTAVHDGTEALAQARRERFDLLLADVMMPGLDGFELLRAIRADEALRTMSVIMLSARAGEEARLQALRAGADDYFVKPFNARELLARVQSQVQLVALRRQAVEREGELMRQIATVRQDLEVLLETTEDAIASFDENLCYRFCNAAVARILGLPRDEVQGRQLSEVAPEIMGTEVERALRTAMTERRMTMLEYFHPLSARWFIVRCYPVERGVVSLGTDITAEKSAQEALRQAHDQLERAVAERTRQLREANELLMAVFERAPGGIAITSPAGRFVRVNRAYERLLGLDEEALKGRGVAEFMQASDWSATTLLLDELGRGERESFALELRYLRADGSTLWVHSFVSAISEEGRPQYFVTIAKDISDRKRAEQRMLASQAELRRLYDRLQSVREEERLALAREVHDQLGQLLSAAKIDIKLLEDDLRASPTLPSRRKLLAELRSARRTMDRAIDSVRQVAMELRPPELDEHGLCEAIRWHARDFERRTRMRFTVEVAADLREPSGAVATALFRIYQEAVTNVLRHARANQVTVALAMRGEAVLLRVRDDGIGFGRRQAGNGASLGMTSMRERAAVCGGRLGIRALRGGGTLVSARVPLGGASAAAI